MSKIEKTLIQYEKLLQSPQSTNIIGLSKLIHEDFYEIGISGKIWTKKEIVGYFQDNSGDKLADKPGKMTHVIFKQLDTQVILLTYQYHERKNHTETISWRTSLWKQSACNWQIIFHQASAMPQHPNKNHG